MHGWVEDLAALKAAGRPLALVTVIRADGSTPREVGAKMLVTAEGLHSGSIGGGKLELLAIRDAQEALRRGEPRVERYPLCVKAGQCCGGNTDVLIEVLNVGPQLYLFGAGHVGQALCRVLEGTAFTVHLVDPRPEWLHAPGLPASVVRHGEPWQDFVRDAEWSDRVYAAVMTHSHDLDRDLVRELSGREAAFVGLIGSKTKWVRFRSVLKGLGVPPDQLERVQCPIGLDLGHGKAPQEVAISVAAQLLKLSQS